jgi:hypothetical protein
MVDIFRASDAASGIVKESIEQKDRLGIKTIWMQLGVISEEAAEMARAAGFTVIMDRCPKIEHGQLWRLDTHRGILCRRRPSGMRRRIHNNDQDRTDLWRSRTGE